eukprot:CAMPEP_0206488370 /NCGR_PEP_ID=MMETSP0324_2-20121206/42364_1 /ASSEMBLY_ACC=CAM_ASM_000836 /TAXON_ID=2866 /ORGANISM="Crypthecodinium cohnii, Strain Seligo" /LENGTH=188 /DNA_ID=CAMNT_0053967365 /DNA_START=68 /DNA_END=635 /DNA_ORIENTATION=+
MEGTASTGSGVPAWARKAALTLGTAAAVSLVLLQLRKRAAPMPAALAPTQVANGKVPTSSPKAAASNGAAPAASIDATEGSGFVQQLFLESNLTAPLVQDIERRLKARYNPIYLDVEDQGGSCSAAKIAIVMVAESFRGQTKLVRQREVQAMCKPYLDFGTLHALSLSLRTPEEYQVVLQKQQANGSA